MNKLKPENVMRSLECCREDLHMCSVCPLNEHNDFCQEYLHRAALALLREKDAEIERLKKYLDYKCIYGYDGEVMEYCVQGPCPHYKTENEIRAEAITEFAESLKNTICVNNEENTEFFDYVFTLETIDKIAKEVSDS